MDDRRLIDILWRDGYHAAAQRMEELIKGEQTVYLISASYPDLDLVDGDLDIYGYNVGSAVGIYHDEQKADEKLRELSAANAIAVENGESIPIEYSISPWTVQ